VTGSGNRVARADAVDLADRVAPGTAQLVYLDPPFAVGVRFGARAEGDGASAHRATGPVAYDDRWPSLDAYLAWLEPRVAAARAVLSERGTMWLHLDHRAVHEAKALCDRVFDRRAFAGEIIWVPGNGSKARRGPGMTHQTILVYAGGPEYVWNAKDPSMREPYADTSLAMHFTNTDADGRAYRERSIGGRTYRYYADLGRSIGSVWADCPAMAANTPLRRETTGYPTQKPLKLLDRIVRAASEPSGLVVDPFCGSGTTLEAAARAGRTFYGGDVGDLAIETTTARLQRAGIAFTLHEGPDGRDGRACAMPRA
jgi:site-specific DNA-methyltransferase (adenine-specific)